MRPIFCYAGANSRLGGLGTSHFALRRRFWTVAVGAPLVAIAKVVFDRIESLKPAGEPLGR